MSITEEEKKILHSLTNAWNDFVDLPPDESEESIDSKDFADAIHAAQKVIALRVARRCNPELWKHSGVTRDDIPEVED